MDFLYISTDKTGTQYARHMLGYDERYEWSVVLQVIMPKMSSLDATTDRCDFLRASMALESPRPSHDVALPHHPATICI